MKDCEIMEQFCKVVEKESFDLNEAGVNQIEEPPDLAIKLIECEYMMRGKTGEMPQAICTELYNKFRHEMPQADITKFREFLGQSE